ncbi:MAG: MGMT family protein [Ectothiorhodospiraceae bacterium]|nr:MGMT family protein [Ectothiorhodospiraceae bacterium]
MSRARPARPPGGAEAPRLQAWRPPGVAPPRAPVATPEPADAGSVYDRIYAWVTRIPPGKVATYGQIAALVGRCTPRMVGYALAALPAERAEVPWQRVVNAAGAVSERGEGGGTDHQQARLRAEGVLLDRRGRIDLERFRWQGPEEPVLGPDPGEGATDPPPHDDRPGSRGSRPRPRTRR